MTPADPIHWPILGCGAIGGLWGCHLAGSGARVTPILRDRQRLQGYPGALTLSDQGRQQVFPLEAETPDAPGSLTRVLVTTKSYATGAALNALAPRLAEDLFKVYPDAPTEEIIPTAQGRKRCSASGGMP